MEVTDNFDGDRRRLASQRCQVVSGNSRAAHAGDYQGADGARTVYVQLGATPSPLGDQTVPRAGETLEHPRSVECVGLWVIERRVNSAHR